MHEPNTTRFNSATTSAAVNGCAFSRPPQPPLYILPGHVCFRLLCHSSRISGLIGKSGSIIKQIQLVTGSKIRVEDSPNSADPRANSPDLRVVSVISPKHLTRRMTFTADATVQSDINGFSGDSVGGSGRAGETGGGTGGNGFSGDSSDGGGAAVEMESVEASPAQEGVVRVFERVVEVAAEGEALAVAAGLVVSCRLLAGKRQVGAVIGKGGSSVEKIRKDTGCRVKVLTSENLPACASPHDEIIEIEGDILAVKKGIIAVTGKLQEYTPPEGTRIHRTGPTNINQRENSPVPNVDLPLNPGSMLQTMPSNSISHSSRSQPLSQDDGNISLTDPKAPKREVVFKILCSNERAGSIIGKGGSIVKALQNETGTSISVGPSLPDSKERLITITAVENPESRNSPAQDAVVTVFSRLIEAGTAKASDSVAKAVSARLIIQTNQVGCLMGKGGAIISEMRKVTGTVIRIIGGVQVPKCASENDEVVQITGEFLNVRDALYNVMGRLRDNILSSKSTNGSRFHNPLMAEGTPSGRPRDPSSHGSHPYLGTSHNQSSSQSQSMNNLRQFHTQTSLASERTSGVNAETTLDFDGHLSSDEDVYGHRSGSASRQTNTAEILVPDNVIGSISGDLTRVEQISGARITMDEHHSGTTDWKIIISGTQDETQAAQSLLQAFIFTGS